MSVETMTAAPVAREQRKFKFDQRYLAPLMITLILALSQTGFGVLESLPQTITAISASIAIEILFGLLTRSKVPHLASAYVTGISAGILVRSTLFWPFALCAAISTGSKYVLRWNGRHLWNPSNFGICMMLLLCHLNTQTLMQQWSNHPAAVVLIWVVGSVIISRLKRFHICATYALSFAFFAFVRSQINGQGFLVEFAPITGPMYQLFTFFMITDPGTTVRTKRGQIIVAFCVAAMECVYRLLYDMHFTFGNADFVENISIHAPYFALFTVGPIANALEIWREKQKTSQNVAADALIPAPQSAA